MKTCCVIGMGPIGNTHARVYKELDFISLSAVCDRIEERAVTAGKKYDVPWFTDASVMLKEMKPDFCSVATGGYEYGSDHLEPVLLALDAGCHVLCEKPLSNEIESARKMVRKAKEMNLCLGTDFNHRFTPAALKAKEWKDNGFIGDELFINMALWIGKFQKLDSPFYHLKALNPHSVDMMRYFCGEIVKVQCFAMKAPGRDIWSTASINMKFENGAVGHLTSSYDIERGHPMERCEVAGTKGRLVVEDMWKEAILYPAGNYEKRVYTNPVFGGYEGFFDTFKARITAFAKQIDQGASPEDIDGSGVDGLKAQTVIQAAIDSLLTGNVIDVTYIY